MVAASGPRVAKGIVALLAIALGAASGETLAPFPGTEPAIASCRAQAHMSVFEELEAQASSGAPGTAPPSVCARVVSNPGLRCDCKRFVHIGLCSCCLMVAHDRGDLNLQKMLSEFVHAPPRRPIPCVVGRGK